MASAKAQVIEMLEADHKQVKQWFKEFDKIDAEADPEAASELVQQTIAALEVHTELEEQVFYPAARETIDDESLMDEAEVEHASAKALISQLKAMTPADDKFCATFVVLGEYVKHHIKEEEGEMFKSLGAGADWDAVLERMTQLREQLMEDKGMPAEPLPRGQAKSGSSSRRSSSAEDRPQAAGKKR